MDIKSMMVVKIFGLLLLLMVLTACGGTGDTELPANATSEPLPTAPGTGGTDPVVGIGVATLGWSPPIYNTDGSTLMDLAGYKIYYGTSPDLLTNIISISNSGLTSFVIENLSSGKTYYFSITAINSKSVESNLSNITSKYITG
jgi:predicted small lipoprotein YifL